MLTPLGLCVQQDMDVDILALVNDTVGTMMTCAYDDPYCEVGVIIGESAGLLGVEEGADLRLCSRQIYREDTGPMSWGGAAQRNGQLNRLGIPHMKF